MAGEPSPGAQESPPLEKFLPTPLPLTEPAITQTDPVEMLTESLVTLIYTTFTGVAAISTDTPVTLTDIKMSLIYTTMTLTL